MDQTGANIPMAALRRGPIDIGCDTIGLRRGPIDIGCDTIGLRRGAHLRRGTGGLRRGTGGLRRGTGAFDVETQSSESYFSFCLFCVIFT